MLLAGLLVLGDRLRAAAPAALGAGTRRRRWPRSTPSSSAASALRTEELNRTNAALATEIAEREAAETRRAPLRDELAQANRLSILGQVSAGVAHEINQPLAAIRTYAESGGRLLDAGHPDEARDNLREIVSVTERIGAITQALARLRPARRRRGPPDRRRGGHRRRARCSSPAASATPA